MSKEIINDIILKHLSEKITEYTKIYISKEKEKYLNISKKEEFANFEKNKGMIVFIDPFICANCGHECFSAFIVDEDNYIIEKENSSFGKNILFEKYDCFEISNDVDSYREED